MSDLLPLNESLEKLGRRIAHLRRQRQFSQDTFALAVGFSRSYVAGIERGRINMTFRNLHRVAEALGVTLTDLMAFEVRPANQPYIDQDE